MTFKLKAALSGLLIGDGLSRQNSVQRLHLTTDRRINRFQTLTRFSFENGITSFPEPYVHAFPEEILKLYPGDDCEWFFFSASTVKHRLDFRQEWMKLAAVEKDIHARLGTKTALRNLANGLRPPQSGHDNPHYFDSIGMLRASAIAAFFEGSFNDLMDLVDSDITHTHSLDGLWCAKALAALVYSLVNGQTLKEGLIEAEKQIPDQSLSAQLIKQSTATSSRAINEIQLSVALEQEIVDRIYCYPYSAPELLALVIAKLTLNSDPQLKFASSFMHRRHNDSLPALLGFLLGLIYGESWLPEVDDFNFQMEGICLPFLKGKTVLDLI